MRVMRCGAGIHLPCSPGGSPCIGSHRPTRPRWRRCALAGLAGVCACWRRCCWSRWVCARLLVCDEMSSGARWQREYGGHQSNGEAYG